MFASPGRHHSIVTVGNLLALLLGGAASAAQQPAHRPSPVIAADAATVAVAGSGAGATLSHVARPVQPIEQGVASQEVRPAAPYPAHEHELPHCGGAVPPCADVDENGDGILPLGLHLRRTECGLEARLPADLPPLAMVLVVGVRPVECAMLAHVTPVCVQPDLIVHLGTGTRLPVPPGLEQLPGIWVQLFAIDHEQAAGVHVSSIYRVAEDGNPVARDLPLVSAELLTTDSLPPHHHLHVQAIVPAAGWQLDVDRIDRGKDMTRIVLRLTEGRCDVPALLQTLRLFVDLGTSPTLNVAVMVRVEQRSGSLPEELVRMFRTQ